MITHTMPVEYPDLDASAARVVMVDHGDAVLGPFSEHAHEYAAAVLERDGVEVRLGTGPSRRSARATRCSPTTRASRPAR